jgi:hypothetical protein
MVGDMRLLTEYFQPEQFDAVWAQGSLLHIPPTDIASVLQSIDHITTKQVLIYIGIKDGEGTVLVYEEKLGKPMQREFMLWHKESFMQQVDKFGWRLIDYTHVDGSQFLGPATLWHKFIFSRG